MTNRVGLILCLLLGIGSAVVIPACARAAEPPAPPAPAPTVPRPPLPPDATPGDREAHYRDEVQRLSMALEQAKVGLDIARRDRDEAELQTWRTWTRWLGLAGVALGVLVGGALSWLISPRIGLPLGLTLVGTGLAVVGFGAALRWLPLALGILTAASLAAWLLYHHRARQALAATARLGDAIETRGAAMIDKVAAKLAQEHAGLHRFVQKARGKK